jgi:hypothetical protein
MLRGDPQPELVLDSLKVRRVIRPGGEFGKLNTRFDVILARRLVRLDVTQRLEAPPCGATW